MRLASDSPRLFEELGIAFAEVVGGIAVVDVDVGVHVQLFQQRFAVGVLLPTVGFESNGNLQFFVDVNASFVETEFPAWNE